MSADNVVAFPEYVDWGTVHRVLADAEEACEDVLVLGYCKGTGDLFIRVSTDLNVRKAALYIIEQAKMHLLLDNFEPPGRSGGDQSA